MTTNQSQIQLLRIVPKIAGTGCDEMNRKSQSDNIIYECKRYHHHEIEEKLIGLGLLVV